MNYNNISLALISDINIVLSLFSFVEDMRENHYGE